MSEILKVKETSPERVAFDLMIQINQYESKTEDEKTREYWLNLYYQCNWVVRGHDPVKIQKNDKRF